MVAEMRHATGVFGRSLLAFFRSVPEYPADFWVMAGAGAFWQVLNFSFVTILFANVDAVGGWNYHQMLMLISFLSLSVGGTALYWDGMWGLGPQVVDGGMDYRITRPAPVMIQVASSHVGMQSFGDLSLALVMFVYGWVGAGIGPEMIPLAVLLLACASVFEVGLLTIANTANFWIKGRSPVFGFLVIEAQNEALRFPLTVFPHVVRVSLIFALPLAFANFIPVQIITGMLGGWWLIAPPVAAAVAVILAIWFFRAGMRAYDSAGH